MGVELRFHSVQTTLLFVLSLGQGLHLFVKRRNFALQQGLAGSFRNFRQCSSLLRFIGGPWIGRGGCMLRAQDFFSALSFVRFLLSSFLSSHFGLHLMHWCNRGNNEFMATRENQPWVACWLI